MYDRLPYCDIGKFPVKTAVGRLIAHLPDNTFDMGQGKPSFLSRRDAAKMFDRRSALH